MTTQCSAEPSLYPHLLGSVRVGAWQLANRMIMAPLTRLRATPDAVPTPMMTTYYAQRASAGFIISEGTIIDEMGNGFARTPGIYTIEQAEAWRNVTNAVHAAGGRIVCQLWHVGRQSHPDLLGGRLPVAPSAVPSPGASPTASGDRRHVTPRALETDEVPEVVEQFGHGAELAKLAGFDGVEIHGAHGYLVDQFLRAATNKRTDRYGGPVENRVRFLCEVTDRVLRAWPADRVGVRLSPTTTFGGMSDDDPLATFSAAIEAINARQLAYVQLTRPRDDASHPLEAFASLVKRPCMVTGRWTFEEAERQIAAGAFDLAGFGRLFIANPDLPARAARGAALNVPDEATFYAGDERGYIDYPAIKG